MIKFVDMRSSDAKGYRFSFWDTNDDRYVEFDGEQAWYDWDDFSIDGKHSKELRKFRSKCPGWVFDG